MTARELFAMATRAARERDAAEVWLSDNALRVSEGGMGVDYSRPVVSSSARGDGMGAVVDYLDRAARLRREAIARCEPVMDFAWLCVGKVSELHSDVDAAMLASRYLASRTWEQVGREFGVDGTTASDHCNAALDWLDANFVITQDGAGKLGLLAGTPTECL